MNLSNINQVLTAAGYDSQLAGRAFVIGVGTRLDHLSREARTAQMLTAFERALEWHRLMSGIPGVLAAERGKRSAQLGIAAVNSLELM